MKPPIEYSNFGLFLLMVGILLINFVLCRMVTASLIKQKFIKRKSPESKKAFILWFFPVIGFLGLLMLLWTYDFLKFWKEVVREI